jgi:uncharacterized protein YqgC (DUF456 family)
LGPGSALGIINFEQGVKITGSRFYVLSGAGARLQRALIAWMLDLHIRQGYTEKYTPFMVKGVTLFGAGQLPKFNDNLYRDHEEDLWMVPTAEVPLTGLHMGDILDEEQLPLYYTAYSPCFRREKMSAGRDVRGIKRGHQFDKVEMYIFCKPDESDDMLEKMLADAEQTCVELGFTYRVKRLCTGDLGFNARTTYDLEVWASGCGEWLEVSSVSNDTDFQARRANIKYRPKEGGRIKLMHTLNGSGLGMPRTLIAVLENNQQEDGSVLVPQVLRPWMGGSVIRRALKMSAWLQTTIFAITLVIMLIGLFGLIVPIFPGVTVIWLAALGFGVVKGFNTLGIWMFAFISLLWIAGMLVDNLFMAAGARQGGAAWSTLLLGILGGVVGTLLLPPVGGLILAPLVIFLIEWRKQRDWRKALQSIRGMAIGWGFSFVSRFGIGILMIICWIIWEMNV